MSGSRNESGALDHEPRGGTHVRASCRRRRRPRRPRHRRPAGRAGAGGRARQPLRAGPGRRRRPPGGGRRRGRRPRWRSSPTGVVVLYNCVNPADYTAWPTYWPPMAAAFLAAAERTGRGAGDHRAASTPTARSTGRWSRGCPTPPPTTKGVLRARMWAEAPAPARGRPDPGGRGARLGLHGARRAATTGTSPGRSPGRAEGQGGAGVRPRRPAALVHRRARHGAGRWSPSRRRRDAWGRVWHAPDQPAASPRREAVADVCRAAGREPVRVKRLPAARCSASAALVVPMLREMRETEYQFLAPYVLDSSAIERELGLSRRRGTRSAGRPPRLLPARQPASRRLGLVSMNRGVDAGGAEFREVREHPRRGPRLEHQGSRGSQDSPGLTVTGPAAIASLEGRGLIPEGARPSPAGASVGRTDRQE